MDDACPWNIDAAPNKYIGAFTNDQHAFRATEINGHGTGCFAIGACAAHGGTAKYFFYHVLVAR